MWKAQELLPFMILNVSSDPFGLSVVNTIPIHIHAFTHHSFVATSLQYIQFIMILSPKELNIKFKKLNSVWFTVTDFKHKSYTSLVYYQYWTTHHQFGASRKFLLLTISKTEHYDTLWVYTALLLSLRYMATRVGCRVSFDDGLAWPDFGIECYHLRRTGLQE